MTGEPRNAWRDFVLLALLGWVVALYATSLGNDFVYDDYSLIVRAPAPASAGELAALFAQPHPHKRTYYRPLTALTLGVQKSLHGNRPAPFHLFNALAMGGVALLAYALLRLPAFAVPREVALLGAGLFALHPAASSCVYPISGREALLCAGFVLATAGAFLRGGLRWRLVALATFAAALLCREQAVVVPPLLILADALGLPADAPGRNARRWLLRHLPFAALLLAYLGTRSTVLGETGGPRLTVLTEPGGPLLSFAYFLQTAFTPFVDLVYEPRPKVWASPWRSWVWPLAVIALAVPAVRSRSRTGAGVLFWAGWAILGLLPTANLVRQEAPFAERHTFLSILGLIGVAAVLCGTVWPRPAVRRGVVGTGMALLVACSVVSLHRGRYFRDNLAFFEQWIRTDEAAPQAHLSLGDWYDRTGRLDEAVAEYRRVLADWPEHLATRHALGAALLERGDWAEGRHHLEYVVRRNPNAALAHFQLGVAWLRQGESERAAVHLEETVRITPRFAPAHFQLGVAAAQRGRHAEAIVHYRRALSLDPALAEARHNLGVSLRKRKPPDERAPDRGTEREAPR